MLERMTTVVMKLEHQQQKKSVEQSHMMPPVGRFFF
jgi:uncharacterized protein YoaH (UPF0181 family)